MPALFRDRQDAGRQLVPHVMRFRAHRPVVLALPRGGVPVAKELAVALGVPLDVLVVRKIGAPSHPEYGMGGIAEGGVCHLDPDIVRMVGATPAQIEVTLATETAELERRVRTYRRGRPLPDVADRTVLIVDDGIATGGTVHAAVRAMRARGAKRVVVVAPVCAADTAAHLASVADEVIAVEVSRDLRAIGRFYVEFDQTSDAEVLSILEAFQRTSDPRR